MLTEIEVSLIPSAGTKRVKLGSAEATFSQKGFHVKGTIDGNRGSGWAIWEGKSVSRDHAAVYRFASPVVAADGAKLQIVLRHDSKHANHNIGRFRLSVTQRSKPSLKGGIDVVGKLLAIPAAKRNKTQAEQVTVAFLESDAAYQALVREKGLIAAEQKKISKSGVVTVMVMADTTKRDTFVLNKGIYSQRRDKVEPGVPGVLPPLPAGAAANRLSLAKWFVDPAHPLTSRVTINRHWQKFFGTGLVKTTEDFGSQGEKPSHPKLLDWLATEFIKTKWNVKAMHRLIVTSATYRQTAQSTPEAFGRDPENRLLARGPRYRLTSWMLRDQALFTSGLLVDQVGGAPVKPYQPGGVWAEATFGKKRYRPDSGEKLYRRSLYVFWRRIVGPTMFFDVAKRQTCEVKNTRTNTPLHALLTLNDVTYVEAARVLAQRLLEIQGTDASRLDQLFTRTVSRKPTAEEKKILIGRLASLRKTYGSDKTAAAALMKVGASVRNDKIDLVEHAAWTGICSLVLNLDETLNK